MHHIVQANLFNEFGFKTLIDALDANGCPYTVVKVVPFAHTLEPEVEFGPDDKVFVWGSLTLDGIAKERGWNPGCLQNENFDMRILKDRFGAFFLNSDATFCTFAEMSFDKPMFCRPVHDTKTFSGTVLTPEELQGWKEAVIEVSNTGYSSLRPETPVMFASPKPIDFEARFFVVDGKVITGSVYRSFGQLLYQRIENDGLFRPMLEWIQRHHGIDTRCLFTPYPIAPGYAIDVAQVGGEYKVIEVNTLNSSGFYDCDMNAVVRALEALYS
jgi:hypothetical protein